MNTYRIIVGNYIGRKQTWNKLIELFVNSDNDEVDLKNAYIQKYSGFNVKVEKIDSVEVVSVDDTKTGNKTSTIKQTRATKIDNEWGDPNQYLVQIVNKDIPDFDAIMKPLREANNKVEEVKGEIKEKIKKIFGLKYVDDFQITDEGVYFKHSGSYFDFRGQSL